MDRNEEALSIIKQSLASNPDNEYLLTTMAFLLYKLGQYEEAKANYDGALQVHPNITEILNDKELIAYNTIMNPNTSESITSENISSSDSNISDKDMATVNQQQPPYSLADELTKLADLRTQGIISEEDFGQLKANIIKSRDIGSGSVTDNTLSINGHMSPTDVSSSGNMTNGDGDTTTTFGPSNDTTSSPDGGLIPPSSPDGCTSSVENPIAQSSADNVTTPSTSDGCTPTITSTSPTTPRTPAPAPCDPTTQSCSPTTPTPSPPIPPPGLSCPPGMIYSPPYDCIP